MRKRIKELKKKKEKNDEVVTNEKVEEKGLSKEEKQKSKKQATNKGKVVVNHPPIEYLPYPCNDPPRHYNITTLNSKNFNF